MAGNGFSFQHDWPCPKEATMMSQKTFSLTSAVIFSLIAVAHLLRSVFGVAWVVEGRTIPMWVSWLALVIGAYLAYEGFRLSRKS
jgi:hypothetical protein